MDKLPEELLCTILRNLRHSDLATAAPTSMKFARIVQSLLYADCQLVDEIDEIQQLILLQCMLRTLLETPELRELVQHLRIGHWVTQTPDARDGRDDKGRKWLFLLDDIDAESMLKCEPVVLSYGVAFQADFYCGLRNMKQDAMTAAILLLLPNLRSLILDMRHMT